MFTLHCRLFSNPSSPPAHAPILPQAPCPLSDLQELQSCLIHEHCTQQVLWYMCCRREHRSRFFGNHSWVHEGWADVLAAG